MIIRKIQPKVPAAKKRAAAYCRVSTLHEEQNESIETQKRYYEKTIQHYPDWELVNIYSDRRSATAVKNRPGFQQMLADAEGRKLDIVLCKSISRFARNIVDCQRYTQWFTTLGVTIIFEEQRIRTDDPTSAFVLSVLSAAAQDESCSISENEHRANESRHRRGEYSAGNHQILGFHVVNGKLVPNQDAWIIREIFRRFLEGESYRKISKSLAAMGAKTLRGNAVFSVESLRYIVRNEAYVGDKLLQKKPPRNYLTQKPDPNREYYTAYLTDDHEPIVDRDTWNRVQEILKRREKQAPE